MNFIVSAFEEFWTQEQNAFFEEQFLVAFSRTYLTEHFLMDAFKVKETTEMFYHINSFNFCNFSINPRSTFSRIVTNIILVKQLFKISFTIIIHYYFCRLEIFFFQNFSSDLPLYWSWLYGCVLTKNCSKTQAKMWKNISKGVQKTTELFCRWYL